MKRPLIHTRALACALAAALVGAAAARAAEPVLLGRGCARNLNVLVEKIGRLAEKFAPGSGAQIAAQAGAFMRLPMWAGVDWTKPATAVLLGGKAFGKKEPVVVMVLALADAQAWKQAHPPNAPMPMHFRISGNQVVVAQEQAALQVITPQHLALYSKMPKLAADANADLYGTLYVGRLVTEYQADIQQAIQEIEQKAAAQPPVGPAAMVNKFVKAALPLVQLAGKQLRRVTLTVSLNAEDVQIAGRLYAQPDTELAALFNGQPKETTDLAKYLPAETVFGGAGKLDIEKAKPLVEAIFAAITQPAGLSDQDLAKVRKLLFETGQTGESAGCIAAGPTHPGMQVVAVTRLNDPAKFREGIKAAVELTAGGGLFGGMVKNMGMQVKMDYKPNAREYKGVSIDRFTITTTPAEGAQPNPMMPQPTTQVIEVAVVGNYAIQAQNNPGGDLMNAAIDRIKGAQAGPTMATSGHFKAALAAAPKDANVVFHIAFNSFMAKVFEQMGQQQPAMAMMFGALFKAEPNEQPLTGYMRFAQNRLDYALRVPHQPIIAMVNRIKAAMQPQKPGPGQPGAKPQPDDDF